MEITNLFTLSQFIDLMEQNCIEFESKKYRLIVNYNSFLEQPLKKEMFVCDVEKPPHVFSDDPREEYSALYQSCDLYIKYKSAQKKVIFDGWSQSVYMKYEIIKGTDIIDFSNYDFPKLSQRNSQIVSVKTLHDLAEATKGQLKLKNVEL